MNYQLNLGIYFKTLHIHKVRDYIAIIEKMTGKSLVINHQEKRDRGLYSVRCSIQLLSTIFFDAVIEACSILSNISRELVISIPIKPEHNEMSGYISNGFYTEFIDFMNIYISSIIESEISSPGS